LPPSRAATDRKEETLRTSSAIRARLVAPVLVAGLLVFSSLFSHTARAQNAAPSANAAPEIEFGYPEQPPRLFTNAQGKPDGVVARFVTDLFAKAGVPWRAVSYPANRLFNNLENGPTTFSVLVRGPALLNCCLINKNPLYTTALNVYYIGDKPPIKNRQDLNGKRIITIRGFTYSGLITYINDPLNQIGNETAATHEAAFEMLSAGRADYVLNYERSAALALAAQPIADVRLDTVERVDTHIVLSKQYPNAEKLMERFDAILKTMNTNDYFK